MDPLTLPARSWLFVPATRADRFAKAAASGADRVIIDLEDAVAPDAKDAARDALPGSDITRRCSDVRACERRKRRPGSSEISASPRRSASRAFCCRRRTRQTKSLARRRACRDAFSIVPIIETAVGRGTCSTSRRRREWSGSSLVRSTFSSTPVCSTKTAPTTSCDRASPLRHEWPRSAHPSTQSVFPSVTKRRSLPTPRRGRRFGCCGKLCIHPNQVRVSNRVFQPTDEEIEWATSVLAECAARPGDAVFAHRGALVDRPVIDRARTIVVERSTRRDLARRRRGSALGLEIRSSSAVIRADGATPSPSRSRFLHRLYARTASARLPCCQCASMRTLVRGSPTADRAAASSPPSAPRARRRRP